MPSVNIDEELYLDIKEYCELNNLRIKTFINSTLKKGFIIEKFKERPPFFKTSANEFERLYSAEPEPVKKKEYINPKVIEVREKKPELTEKEKRKKRIQFL